jgi:hypothetical protein
LKPSGARLLVGNLFFENEIARAAYPERRRPPRISRLALDTVSGQATLLRAFAREGDRLWLPAAVDPDRVLPVPGLPVPRLESGPLEPADQILAWGETPQISALRLLKAENARVSLDGPLHEVVWNLPPPPVGVTTAVNHRSFCLEIADRLGYALPGARMIESRKELDRHLRSVHGGWVVKAPLSAAGRYRYIHHAGESLDDPLNQGAVERLLELQRPLLFEPWMDRTADFGCVALLTPSGLRLAGFHRLLVNSSGHFHGIELRAAFRGIEGLDNGEKAQMEEVFNAVAAALRQAGYTGPFGIDAWRYRRPDGTPAFQPLGEINARMTFGLVARALVDRVREPLGLRPDDPVRLLFGGRISEAGPGFVPLLRMGAPSHAVVGGLDIPSVPIC